MNDHPGGREDARGRIQLGVRSGRRRARRRALRHRLAAAAGAGSDAGSAADRRACCDAGSAAECGATPGAPSGEIPAATADATPARIAAQASCRCPRRRGRSCPPSAGCATRPGARCCCGTPGSRRAAGRSSARRAAPSWPVLVSPRAGRGTDGKVIYPTREAAEAAARELEALGARSLRAYRCSRSRRGHFHLTTDSTPRAAPPGPPADPPAAPLRLIHRRRPYARAFRTPLARPTPVYRDVAVTENDDSPSREPRLAVPRTETRRRGNGDSPCGNGDSPSGGLGGFRGGRPRGSAGLVSVRWAGSAGTSGTSTTVALALSPPPARRARSVSSRAAVAGSWPWASTAAISAGESSRCTPSVTSASLPHPCRDPHPPRVPDGRAAHARRDHVLPPRRRRRPGLPHRGGHRLVGREPVGRPRRRRSRPGSRRPTRSRRRPARSAATTSTASPARVSRPPTIAARAASSASSAPPPAAARAAASAATCAAPYAAAVSPMPSATATPSPPPCAQTASASALNRRRPWSLAEPVVGRAVPMVASPMSCTPLSRVHAESGKRLWIRRSGMAGCRPCRTAPAPVSPPSPRTSSTSTPCSRPTTTGTPIRASPPSGWRSAPRGTAARRCPPRSTTTTSRPPARPSSSTGRRRAPTGPLFIGRDTHALSEPAWVTACEVFLANDVHVLVDSADGYTPTPAVSTAIIGANRGRTDGPRRRRRHHPEPQPAPRRRLQVQPAARRPGRHRRHELDRRTAPTSCCSPSSTASSGARSTAARWAGSTSSAST